MTFSAHVLACCFGSVTVYDLVSSIELVCRAWRQVCVDPQYGFVWSNAYVTQWRCKAQPKIQSPYSSERAYALHRLLLDRMDLRFSFPDFARNFDLAYERLSSSPALKRDLAPLVNSAIHYLNWSYRVEKDVSPYIKQAHFKGQLTPRLADAMLHQVSFYSQNMIAHTETVRRRMVNKQGEKDVAVHHLDHHVSLFSGVTGESVDLVWRETTDNQVGNQQYRTFLSIFVGGGLLCRSSAGRNSDDHLFMSHKGVLAMKEKLLGAALSIGMPTELWVGWLCLVCRLKKRSTRGSSLFEWGAENLVKCASVLDSLTETTSSSSSSSSSWSSSFVLSAPSLAQTSSTSISFLPIPQFCHNITARRKIPLLNLALRHLLFVVVALSVARA
eukprot:TRINITY_DN3277_c1_g1_i1.p1 TRINITY_DN3277_c1_g1~~TRINITY_DN3277_c1_g1_i1.p1  ORF type:complete len:386 (+),score=52.15 TRINITY_DN3277_c1_g1_i1:58-1215(+)